jgi:hypothetical protein
MADISIYTPVIRLGLDGDIFSLFLGFISYGTSSATDLDASLLSYSVIVVLGSAHAEK